MSGDFCLWKLLFQTGNQIVHCLFLFRCPVVFRLIIVSFSSGIANTDTVCVVSGGVRSWLFYRAALLYRAIAADDLVISNVVESALKMPLSDFVHTDVHPRIGVRTMDYDKVNFSHVSCV